MGNLREERQVGDTAPQTRPTRKKPAREVEGGTTGATAAWVICASGKGGTTKTTTCLNLATIAAAQGVRTLLVDTDEQATLSKWFDRREELRRKKGADVPGLRLISIPLSSAEQAIREVEAAKGVDLVLVDTPPGLEQRGRIRALLERADLVLVPTSQSVADTDAATEFMSAVRALGRNAVFLIGRATPRWGTYRTAKKLLNRCGTLCPVDIRFLSDIDRCHTHGLGINEFSGVKGAEDFEAAWDFVRKEIGKWSS